MAHSLGGVIVKDVRLDCLIQYQMLMLSNRGYADRIRVARERN